MDIGTTVWLSKMGTTVSPIFNASVLSSSGLIPSQVIFEAVTAYRIAQEQFNSGVPSGGPYINFASSIQSDATASLDAMGEISISKRVSLQAKVVFAPVAGIKPQRDITII